MTTIAELKGLYEKATKGPWHAWQPAKTGIHEREWIVSRFDPEYSHRDMEAIVCSLNSDGSNACLIEEMHRHLPALLEIAKAAQEWQEVLNAAAKDKRIGLTMLQAGALSALDDALSNFTKTGSGESES